MTLNDHELFSGP